MWHRWTHFRRSHQAIDKEGVDPGRTDPDDLLGDFLAKDQRQHRLAFTKAFQVSKRRKDANSAEDWNKFFHAGPKLGTPTDHLCRFDNGED